MLGAADVSWLGSGDSTHLHGGGDFLQGGIRLLLFGLEQRTLFRRPPLQLVHQRLGFVQLGHSRLQENGTKQTELTRLFKSAFGVLVFVLLRFCWETNKTVTAAVSASVCVVRLGYLQVPLPGGELALLAAVDLGVHVQEGHVLAGRRAVLPA